MLVFVWKWCAYMLKLCRKATFITSFISLRNSIGYYISLTKLLQKSAMLNDSFFFFYENMRTRLSHVRFRYYYKIKKGLKAENIRKVRRLWNWNIYNSIQKNIKQKTKCFNDSIYTRIFWIRKVYNIHLMEYKFYKFFCALNPLEFVK